MSIHSRSDLSRTSRTAAWIKLSAHIPTAEQFAAAFGRGAAALRKQLPALLELTLLAIWTIWFVSPYLNFDPLTQPAGVDFFLTVNFHHLWTRWRECGLCFFWNGGLNGGAPALADLFPSSLHPLVIVTTLGWGVINGSKIALVGIFFMAGLAQWWLARVLGLGWLARMWSALLAVVAGNIAGRMQMGWFGVALATASVALIFPPFIRVALTGSRRAAVLSGILLACAAVAGQGYIQFGFILLLPLTLILLPWGKPNFGLVARRYAQAFALAFLLAAPFVLSFALNFSQVTKAADVNFGGIQPFTFIPLSFVVNDPRFYGTPILAMAPFPALYVNYIGWMAILLALVGVRMARAGTETRVMLFLLLAAMTAVIVASLEPRQFINQQFPKSWLGYQIMSLRSSPVIAGLAVLPILGLGAIGVDRLFVKLAVQLQIGIQNANGAKPLAFTLNWLLVLPLIWGVWNVKQVTQGWIRMDALAPNVPRVIAALHTPTLEWVNFPWGEVGYLESAMARGLKIAGYPFAWGWKDRPSPAPALQAEGKWAPKETVEAGSIPEVDGIKLYRAATNQEYAQVEYASAEPTICAAQGDAGDIDVACETRQAGELVVKENNWSGWNVTVDGKAAQIENERWIALALPAGKHLIQLRYRPWEGMLGFALLGLGCVWAIFLWRKPNNFAAVNAEQVQDIPSRSVV